MHHVSVRPDGTTALHECVARGYDRIADLLLNYGASPFLENGRGELQLMEEPSSGTSQAVHVTSEVVRCMDTTNYSTCPEGVFVCRFDSH